MTDSTGYWMSPAGAYYGGDQQDLADVEVPARPSPQHVWQDGAWALDIAALQAAAVLRIDDAAEALRLRFIAAGYGMMLSYQNKVRVADAWEQAGSPEPATGFPNILAEVGITGATAAEVVQVWRDKNAEWQQLDAAIEAARLGAKKTVDAQTDPVAAVAAIAAAVAGALATFDAMRPT